MVAQAVLPAFFRLDSLAVFGTLH